ncbi:hypothetical protein [Serratia marcescens]|uniref:hypothetical protein n=1 Tax=Serratia marcescens TaxID=615 RepID=UPI0040465254
MIDIKENQSLDCLAIIGSHARGDDDANSDVDLLGIVSSNDHQMINAKKINLSVYSETYLRKMMVSGDIFALHILTEGIPLINSRLFYDICGCFKYRSDYRKDRKVAYLMGRVILSKANEITNWHVANKRITWCIRTYLLSLMAESKKPMFSKEDIAFYGHIVHDTLSYQEYLMLVNAKQQSGYSQLILSLLKRFLVEISSSKPNEQETQELLLNESILINTSEQIMFDEYH